MDKTKIYREFKGLTASELSEKYNLPQETIENILKDSRGSSSAIELAKKYGLSRQRIYKIVEGVEKKFDK